MITGVLERAVIAIVQALIGTVMDAINFVFTWPGGLFDPYNLTGAALSAARTVEHIGFLLIGLAVVWVGLRVQIVSAMRLPGRGADLERMVLAAVMVLASVWFCQQVLYVNNAITTHFANLLAGLTGGSPGALLDTGLSGLGAALTMATAAVGVVFGIAVLGLLALLAALVISLILFILYAIRTAEIVFFTATMPVWSALYAFPETAGVLRAAWVEYAVAVFQQGLGVIAWWLAMTLLYHPSAGSGWQAALADLFTSVGLLYVVLRIPGTLRRLLNAGAGGRGFVGSLAEAGIVATRLPQVFSMLGNAVRFL